MCLKTTLSKFFKTKTDSETKMGEKDCFIAFRMMHNS